MYQWYDTEKKFLTKKKKIKPNKAKLYWFDVLQDMKIKFTDSTAYMNILKDCHNFFRKIFASMTVKVLSS